MNEDKRIVYTICDDKQIKMTRDVFDYLMTVKHYNKKLKQENEKLKDDNITLVKNQIKCNSDYFRIVKENEKEKQFIKDCGFQNQQQLVLAYLDYKSRCKKAIEYINEHTLFVNGGIIKSILKESDNNETNS